MEFSFREQEINELRRLRWLSEEQYSRTLVLTGIMGIGKTALIRQALSGHTVVHLFASHKSEGLLVRDLRREISFKLSIGESSIPSSLNDILDFLFEQSKKSDFTLVVDEFHLLSDDVLSHFATLIRERKRKTGLNLVLVSSDEIASRSLYENEGSILFNCIDSTVSLKPFSLAEMKSLLSEKDGGVSKPKLLKLYAMTGGIPRYVDALLSSKDFMKEVFSQNSLFLEDGNVILSSILGKNSEIYYSILEVIARGAESQSEIEASLGGTFNVGGHLAKLETVYGLLQKSRPSFSPTNSRGVVRYSITNPFLWFWFRYVEYYRSLIRMGEYDKVIDLVEKKLTEDSILLLGRYFRDKLHQENEGFIVGSWWVPSSKSEASIPLVAFSERRKKIILADVCSSATDFDKDKFLKSVKRFKMTTGKSTGVDSRLFVLEDM